MLVDYARIAHVLGDPVSAELARTEATEIYTRLGAPAYVDRVAAERKARAATSVSTTQTVLLTEREQDVLTLVTSGMSMPADRPGPLRHPQHRELPPLQHLPEGPGRLSARSHRALSQGALGFGVIAG